MYLPYIRTKQYDLAAIIELNPAIYAKSKVVPIIEPVTKAVNKKQFAKLITNNTPFILVVNPIVGPLASFIPNPTIIDDLVEDVFNEYDDYCLGFIIHPQTTLRHIKQFLANFPNHRHAFIHFYQFGDSSSLVDVINEDDNKAYNIFIDGKVSLDYINEFAGIDTYDVLIRDGFVKQIKNELYPDRDFFYDLHKNYNTELGYDGFGDFTIIGSQFQAGGGPAFVVALHLTDLDERNDIIVRHFKSDITPPLTTTNPGGKFSYALSEMIKYLRTNPGLSSQGITEYKALHRNGNFPGLGVPKKLSIMHHIETIFNEL